MSTLIAQTATGQAAADHHAVVRRAQAALAAGAAAAVGLAAIGLFVKTTSGDGAFHHAGDYWLTGDGIPYMIVLLVLLPALRTLQNRRDGRLGQTGIALASLGAAVLTGMFAYGLAAANSSSLGPTYVLAALATILGLALFAAGSWRARLLPRWLLPVWVIAWAVGSTLPFGVPTPLLLAAVYLTIAALLPGRVAERDGRF